MKNVVISNYNRCKLLTFTQKNRRASKHVSACSEASVCVCIFVFVCVVLLFTYYMVWCINKIVCAFLVLIKRERERGEEFIVGREG